MEFVLGYNDNLDSDSGLLSFMFSQYEESTGTNDTVSSRSRLIEQRLVKNLRKSSEFFKKKPELKSCWDGHQPYVYALKGCQDDDITQECYYFEEHKSTMEFLSNLKDNWDSYGAEAPNVASFREAKKTLDYLQAINFPPTKLVPSVEGGISFLFIRGNKYADIECDNDGDIICGLSDRENDPLVWEVGEDKNLFATVEKIREFFRR